ncbi:YlxR family protein [Georgenia alba]|uniref:YlxR family protein n=1 Tax=Georgenia alba TaxID=2233858 RepID=A0ABW2QCC9_9MICO
MTPRSDPPTPTGPVRTCTGCRRRAPRSVLVRLVLVDATSRVEVDPGKRAPGRGAWLHPSRECLDLALRRRAIGRALRAARPVDTDAVAAWFDGQISVKSPDVMHARVTSTEKAGWKPMGTR